MEQNSNSWLEWRRQGLGASDAPIVMGISPWTTPFQLWEQKMGFKQSQENFATRRGHDLEPKARAMFELESDASFEPKLAVHKDYTWLRASLDGYNEKYNQVLEIKCPGSEDHKRALEGKVPEKYWPQLQHQLLVTGAESVIYYSFDGKSGVKICVEPDIFYIEKLFKSLENFWKNHVLAKSPPPLTEKDSVILEDKDLIGLAGAYAEFDDEIKDIKKKMEKIKKQILEKISHPKAKVGRLSIVRTARSGPIDYDNVPELKNIDLEKYRKEPTETTTIRVGKK